MKKQTQFIAYYRTSTRTQDLGLLAQRSAVTAYINTSGGTLIDEYQEKESGANKDRISHGSDINLSTLLSRRPLLLSLIERAKKEDLVIIVKEVTRLTRFSLLYEYLVATGIKFTCSDYPNDSPLMMGFRVKIGEDEAMKISERTIRGLEKSTKPRGYKGASNLKKVDRKKRIKAIKQRAIDNPNNKRAAGYICELIKSGKTFSFIAITLNTEGFRTARGLSFAATTVKRLYERVA